MFPNLTYESMIISFMRSAESPMLEIIGMINKRQKMKYIKQDRQP